MVSFIFENWFFRTLRFDAIETSTLQAGQQDQAVRGKVSSWFDEDQHCAFTQLRIVKVGGISGVKAEVALIRFLLLNSPVLEKMIVWAVHQASGDRHLLKKLLQFRRASAQAEIKYLDPLNDVQANAGSNVNDDSESQTSDSSSSSDSNSSSDSD